ncbi:hypothetical protein HDU93_006495 [Gonapodya sp. JEL0774]|nr:hypothetical protein HDU93_006495 [Gonapodya sp. JEL0774]
MSPHAGHQIPQTPLPTPFPPRSPFPEQLALDPTNPRYVTRLFLCRHGETDANAARVLQGSGIDMSLNDRGLRQALALGKRMQDVDIRAVWASNLKRAKETAQAVHALHPTASLHSHPDLREISWGDWEGKSHAPGLMDMIERWEHEGDFDAKPPGEKGESPNMVRNRVAAVMGSIVESGGEGSVLVVAHGRTLRILLAHLIYNSLAYMPAFHHENCCVNILDVLCEVLPPSSLLSDPPTSLADSHAVATTSTTPTTAGAVNDADDASSDSDDPGPTTNSRTVKLDGDVSLSRHHLARPEVEGWVGPAFVYTVGGTKGADVERRIRVRFKPVVLNDTGHMGPGERGGPQLVLERR